MKVLLLILLIAIGVVLYLVLSGDSGTQPESKPATTTTQPQKPQAPNEGVVGEVLGGAVGYTQFKAGQRAKDKVRTLNDKNNKQLEDAMNQ